MTRLGGASLTARMKRLTNPEFPGGRNMIRTIFTLAFIAVAFPAAADTLTLAPKYEAVGTTGRLQI